MSKIYTRKIKQIGGRGPNKVCDNNFNIKTYTNNISCNRLAVKKNKLVLHPDKNRECEDKANIAFKIYTEEIKRKCPEKNQATQPVPQKATQLVPQKAPNKDWEKLYKVGDGCISKSNDPKSCCADPRCGLNVAPNIKTCRRKDFFDNYNNYNACTVNTNGDVINKPKKKVISKDMAVPGQPEQRQPEQRQPERQPERLPERKRGEEFISEKKRPIYYDINDSLKFSNDNEVQPHFVQLTHDIPNYAWQYNLDHQDSKNVVQYI